MEKNKISLGILGCSRIVQRAIITPLKDIKEIVLTGISSRTYQKAVQFKDEFGIPEAYESYDKMLCSKDIDAVYIALPNNLHKEWVIKAVNEGKHVLVEKPLCMNTDEYFEIEKACKEKQQYVLEGLMVQHHPWQRAVKDIVKKEEYGKLRRISTHISFLPKGNIEENYRSFPEKGGGVFYDLGCYWIQFLRKCVDGCIVKKEGFSRFGGINGCDWTFHAEIYYEEDIKASFICSFEMPYKALHRLEFDEAKVIIDDFFRANLGNYKITINIEDMEGNKNKIVFEPQNYYANQLRHFAYAIAHQEERIHLGESYSRISLQEEIMKDAKMRHLGNF